MARKMRGELHKVDVTTTNGRPGAWICALGLVICLMGCQARFQNATVAAVTVAGGAATPAGAPHFLCDH